MCLSCSFDYLFSRHNSSFLFLLPRPCYVLCTQPIPRTDPLFFSSTVSVSRSLSHTGLVWRRSWRPMHSGDRLWGHSRLRTSPTCRNSKVCTTVSKLWPNLYNLLQYTLFHCHFISFLYLTTHQLSSSVWSSPPVLAPNLESAELFIKWTLLLLDGFVTWVESVKAQRLGHGSYHRPRCIKANFFSAPSSEVMMTLHHSVFCLCRHLFVITNSSKPIRR